VPSKSSVPVHQADNPPQQAVKTRSISGSQSVNNPSIDPPLSQPDKTRSTSGSQSMNNPSIDPQPPPDKTRSTSGSQSVNNPSINPPPQPDKTRSTSGSQSVNNPSIDSPAQSATNPSAGGSQRTACANTASASDPFLDGQSASLLPRVMTSTPAASDPPRFSIRTLSSEIEAAVVNDEDLEVVGLDEMVARPSVTARQRKPKSSSSSSSAATNITSPRATRNVVELPKETTDRPASSHAVKQLLHKSTKFAKMTLLDIGVDPSSSRKDPASVYDVAAATDSDSDEDTLTTQPSVAGRKTTARRSEGSAGEKKPRSGCGRWRPTDIINIPTTSTSDAMPRSSTQLRRGRKGAWERIRKDRKSSESAVPRQATRSLTSVPANDLSAKAGRRGDSIGGWHATRSVVDPSPVASALPDSQTPTRTGEATEPKRRRLDAVHATTSEQSVAAVMSDVEPDDDQSPRHVVPHSRRSKRVRSDSRGQTVSGDDDSSPRGPTQRSKSSKRSSRPAAMSDVEPDDDEEESLENFPPDSTHRTVAGYESRPTWTRRSKDGRSKSGSRSRAGRRGQTQRKTSVKRSSVQLQAQPNTG